MLMMLIYLYSIEYFAIHHDVIHKRQNTYQRIRLISHIVYISQLYLPPRFHINGARYEMT